MFVRTKTIRIAIAALDRLAIATDDSAKATHLREAAEILAWAAGEKHRGVGFGKFIALTLSQIDQAIAENRDG